ncbi:MAG TPA: protein-glutamate O-methyltransferase CheR [Accumulibacter sp.]|uniref:CheR family methyltransferase n=1 Tax=Accumulibacter sp. TaxID=2053492 RepID=UPI00263767B6|nr:protein-glutamate O-methyltransferase CheR [Accumulibacter sp.]MDS4056769.1 protein-glutamate O-methyltransferase CheR [Accumulibacter sp.]HMV06929.1 protein-glutamate O-methyltransferase CheR [Accumulibacter sp.]HMW80220.1 protein-glutamate O-methyltransferase CheR [Accumulibacter sp.]HMX68073.1 protein-glutamate O-methyltransferase CheR [Accumulibacter sp.]HNB67283.1 protein-glutamate O-methyltransferase CheR [Accumulibacter sp.]
MAAYGSERAGLANASTISDQEFALFQRLIHQLAGISLADSKKVLLVGRLQRRLREYGLNDFGSYYRLLVGGQHPTELQTMVDLLTTNETYFFREAGHFDFLRDAVLATRRSTSTFRIWSAASSTGEEAYSMAMVLAEALANSPWEVFASDISTRVLDKARSGLYANTRTEGIPPALRRKYCLPGDDERSFCIAPQIRQRVRFQQVNLTRPIDPRVGSFDVVFLRNVMIYFDTETKRQVVGHLLPRLLPGGYFIVGHSESLSGIGVGLAAVRPTIYRKV